MVALVVLCRLGGTGSSPNGCGGYYGCGLSGATQIMLTQAADVRTCMDDDTDSIVVALAALMVQQRLGVTGDGSVSCCVCSCSGMVLRRLVHASNVDD
jgi:hypothetical protein